MEFRPIERTAQAFQQPLTAEQIQAVCRRVFGAEARAVCAVELGLGMYNNTYRVTVTGQERPVILRVAPEPGRQFRSERQLMRNEYASVPWLAVIASLMPRVIAADWSQEVIARDWMIQSLLDGVPAPDRVGAYPRSAWPGFYRQLGAIAKAVHATEPRMLSGDLWTVNMMLADGAPEPTITRVLDMDRTSWGDPAADWTIRMALAQPGTERDAFWHSDGYGALDRSAAAQWRSRIYQARHIGAVRLECHRLGSAAGVRGTYQGVGAVLAGLA